MKLFYSFPVKGEEKTRPNFSFPSGLTNEAKPVNGYEWMTKGKQTLALSKRGKPNLNYQNYVSTWDKFQVEARWRKINKLGWRQYNFFSKENGRNEKSYLSIWPVLQSDNSYSHSSSSSGGVHANKQTNKQTRFSSW